MNAQLIMLELVVIVTGLALLLIDLWIPAEKRGQLGYAAAAVLGCALIGSFAWHPETAQYAFSNSYVLDPLALYFKRFFLFAAILVLIMSVDFADRILVGITEF